MRLATLSTAKTPSPAAHAQAQTPAKSVQPAAASENKAPSIKPTGPTTKLAKIENAAENFADKKLQGGPVFLGRINGSKREATVIKNADGKVTGIRVWTGDEASPQFTNFIVKIKDGKPIKLKADNSP